MGPGLAMLQTARPSLSAPRAARAASLFDAKTRKYESGKAIGFTFGGEDGSAQRSFHYPSK